MTVFDRSELVVDSWGIGLVVEKFRLSGLPEQDSKTRED